MAFVGKTQEQRAGMVTESFLQRPSPRPGITVRSDWAQPLKDKRTQEKWGGRVLGSLVALWCRPGGGGFPSTTCSFPSSHSPYPKPWKSQKNPEGRTWIYLLSSFSQKLGSTVAFMVTTWMLRPPGSDYQLCLPIHQFAKCYN